MKRIGSYQLLCQVWVFLPSLRRRLIIAAVDLAANMIGRSNARRGARRIFAVLQNRRLNQHIVYTIIDEVSLCRHKIPNGLQIRLLGVHGVIP